MMQLKPSERPASDEEARLRMAQILARVGISDLREELTRFAADYNSYAEYDRKRLTLYANERVSLSLSNNDKEGAKRWLNDLERYDYNLARQLRIQLGEKPPKKPGSKSWLKWPALAIALIALSTLAYILWPTNTKPSATYSIRIAATHPSEVLLKGEPLGRLPQLKDLKLSGVSNRLLFRRKGEPTLEFYLEQDKLAGKALFIDWEKKSVELIDASSLKNENLSPSTQKEKKRLRPKRRP